MSEDRLTPLGRYRTLADLPAVAPVFPLDGALLLPGGTLPLRIFEPRYLAMIDDAFRGERLIGMIQTWAQTGAARIGWPSEAQAPRLARVGCAGRLTSYEETPDGCYLIGLTGVCRFRAGDEPPSGAPYRQLRLDFAPFAADLTRDGDAALEFDRPPFLDLLRRYLDRRGLGIEWEAVNAAPAAALIDSLSMALPFSPMEKQALLEAGSLDSRRVALTALLRIGAEERFDEGDTPPPLLQ